jgi:hypothetical protein
MKGKKNNGIYIFRIEERRLKRMINDEISKWIMTSVCAIVYENWICAL